MSYLGLTPSEDTSGEKRRQGAITKTGSRATAQAIEGAELLELEAAEARVPAAPIIISSRPLTTSRLSATPIGQARGLKLRKATFPRSQLSSVVNDALSLSEAAKVGPLAVTTAHLRPGGGRLGVVAAGLGNPRSHRVLLVLQGPGVRLTRLLGVHHNAVGASIQLPKKLAQGTWIVAVENLSGVHAAGRGLAGDAIVRLGTFTVAAKTKKPTATARSGSKFSRRLVIGFLGPRSVTPTAAGGYVLTLAPTAPGARGTIELRDSRDGPVVLRRDVVLTRKPLTVSIIGRELRRTAVSPGGLRHLTLTVSLSAGTQHSARAARRYELKPPAKMAGTR